MDPRSLGSKYIKGTDESFKYQGGFAGSFDVVWSERFQIAVPDLDHPNATHVDTYLQTDLKMKKK